MDGHGLLAGRYELRGLLGRGGMAEVRDGWDTRLDRAVAVKLLHPALGTQPDIRKRFEDEARSAAGLNHPNIVSVYDFGEHEGTPYIVMERLPGETVADRIAQGPLTPPQASGMLSDVLAALTVAHDAGVLHRDIKPGNILVSTSGDTMKVADFGIAKTAGAALTMTGQIIGTMAYMSPERIRGAPASVADDLYAVGLIGYEALTGRRAFPQDNPASLAHSVMSAPPPPLAVIRPDVDPVLTGVVDRAMSRDPGQRFASADQMRAALSGDHNALLAGAALARPATKVLDSPLPGSGTYAAPSAAYYVPRSRRPVSGRTKLMLGAGAVVAFIIAAVAVASDPFSAPQPAQPLGTSTSKPPPTTSPPPPAPTSVFQPEPETDEEQQKRAEEQQKKLEEQQKKREEEQEKRQEEQRKRE